jgi:hypothetical protein
MPKEWSTISSRLPRCQFIETIFVEQRTMAIFQTNEEEEEENEEDNHHVADLERMAVETIESVGFDAAIIYPI